MSSITTSTAVQSPPLSKRTETMLKIAMAVLSPLLFIGLLEGVAYIWERVQANGPYAWELVASRRMKWIQYHEPGAGYTLMKPDSHYEWQSIPVNINSHGLRNPETTFEKPLGTIRILNLGDSVAMGWGVRLEDTYGQQLEALLNKQGGGDMSYEVINAGVPGWNLENELAYLQAEGLQYEPDLILLDLTLANDIKGKSALLAENQPAPIKWLRSNTYFWPFLSVQLRWMEARAQGRDRIDVIEPPTEPDKYFPSDPESKQWKEFWNQVSAIDHLAGEKDIPVVLIIFPLEFQVIDESYPTLPQDLLTAKATEAGIPAIDPLPAFRQACLEKRGGACYLEDRYLFADVWMHPSSRGHKLIADELKAFLTQMVEH
ncbi:MAG TPA: GDSL-type esterase/lipase family protein [Anaerolineales bacterium]|nr:GDSL-type esterase/lipase family protein [Anaerolineales bacterium]